MVHYITNFKKDRELTRVVVGTRFEYERTKDHVNSLMLAPKNMVETLCDSIDELIKVMADRAKRGDYIGVLFIPTMALYKPCLLSGPRFSEKGAKDEA